MNTKTTLAAPTNDGLTQPTLPTVLPVPATIAEPVTPPPFTMPRKEVEVPLISFPDFWIIGVTAATESSGKPRLDVCSLESAPSFAFDAWLQLVLEQSHLQGLLRIHRASWPLIERWEAVTALTAAGVAVSEYLFTSKERAVEILNALARSKKGRAGNE